MAKRNLIYGVLLYLLLHSGYANGATLPSDSAKFYFFHGEDYHIFDLTIQCKKSDLIKLCNKITRENKTPLFSVCKVYMNFTIDTNSKIIKNDVEFDADSSNGTDDVKKYINTFFTQADFKLTEIKWSKYPLPLGISMEFTLYTEYYYDNEELIKSNRIRFFSGIFMCWNKPVFHKRFKDKEIITDGLPNDFFCHPGPSGCQ